MATLNSGQHIANQYVLEKRIGEGGHAEIWSAHEDGTTQRVALKFLHAELAGHEEAAAVINHEWQMLRRLTLPGVLQAEPLLKHEDRLFLPLELAEGGDLKSLQGASYLVVVPVLLELARVLDAIHARGVVHRDLKPGNVLRTQQGAVRLADFGTATLVGSTQSFAPGSPFSASPQQLRGNAAAVADDVYGLGALAYELLGGYPPFFPNFDQHRVQAEDPARLMPSVSAPPRLIQLVMSMLAREPESRPGDMNAVIEGLEQALTDTPLMAIETSSPMPSESLRKMVIQEAPVDAQAPPINNKGSRTWLAWGAAALALLVSAALLIELKPYRPPPVATSVISLEAPEGAEAALQQTTEQAATRAITSIDSSLSDSQTKAEQALAAAEVALNAGQPAVARAAFEQVRQLAPETPALREAPQRVAKLERLIALHSAGLKAETSGQWDAALQQYNSALALDQAFGPSREARDRILAAKQESLSAAQRAAAERDRQAANQRDERVGDSLEINERWSEAETHYRQVLARDPSAKFAQDAIKRATRRAELEASMDRYLAQPERLTASAVRTEAEGRLREARETGAASPLLTSKTERLATLLSLLDVEARVSISSDSLTRISIGRVGELGNFSTHELSLKPGRYTLLGKRSGYRDVRRELSIAPGQRSVSISIECSERI